jgi:hypothetical protein
MIDHLTTEMLDVLAECDSEVCVSIYFADGTERRRDPGQLSATETCLQGWRPNAWLRGACAGLT